jgi:hypothetical protein
LGIPAPERRTCSSVWAPLATKLVNELVEATDERQLAKTIAHYGRVERSASTNSSL